MAKYISKVIMSNPGLVLTILATLCGWVYAAGFLSSEINHVNEDVQEIKSQVKEDHDEITSISTSVEWIKNYLQNKKD